MILNVSYRTDIVACFWPWWKHRLETGVVSVRNPYYPEKVSRYHIIPQNVDCISYISKDYAPMLEDVDAERLIETWPSHFTYTINAYGRDMEGALSRTLAPRVEHLKQLSDIASPSQITWNYNPVLINDKYTLEYHLCVLETMFEAIAPYVGAFSFDFVNIYEKVARNAPDVRPPDTFETAMLLNRIDELVGSYDLRCTTCNKTRVREHIPLDTCCNLRYLVTSTGGELKRRLSEKTKSACTICGQIAHPDVGCYDSCNNGCRYCYATKSPRHVAETLSHFDPESEILCDTIRDTDIVSEPKIVTYRA